MQFRLNIGEVSYLRLPSLLRAAVFVLPAGLCLGQETPRDTVNQAYSTPAGTKQELQPKILYRQNRDIGVLEWVEATEPPPTLTLASSQNFFYTDNVYLTDQNRRESLGWNGWFSVNLIPYSTYRWTPVISYQHDLFRYDRESLRDFDTDILGFGSRLYLSEDHAWFWTASYSLWRMYSSRGDLGEFYKQGELANSLNWARFISQQPDISLGISYGVLWRHVSPARFDQVDTGLAFALAYYPLKQLEIGAFVRPEARYYPTDTATIKDRHDFNLITSAGVSWYPFPYLGLGTGVSWMGNYSDVARLGYESVMPMVSIMGQVSF